MGYSSFALAAGQPDDACATDYYGIRRCQRPGEHSVHFSIHLRDVVDRSPYAMMMLHSTESLHLKPCVQSTSRFNPETPAAIGTAGQASSASICLKFGLVHLCCVGLMTAVGPARPATCQRIAVSESFSAAYYYRRVCFDFWLEMARGCASGVNFGPRFVTHEDRRARNNWRDPAERLGGPAVNAGRILTDRPSPFVLRRDCRSSAERRKREARQTQHAGHIGAAVGGQPWRRV